MKKFKRKSIIINYFLKCSWPFTLSLAMLMVLLGTFTVILWQPDATGQKHVLGYIIVYENHTGYNSHSGLEASLSILFLGPVSILFTAVFSLILSHLYFAREIKKGQMHIWLTSSISRSGIFASKILSLWISIIITMIAPIMIILFSSLSAYDYNDIILPLILEMVTMLVLNIFIATIILAIYIALMNKRIVALICSILLICFIGITYMFVLMEDSVLKDVPYIWVIKWFSIENLYVDLLKNYEPDYTKLSPGIHTFTFNVVGDSFGWRYIAPIISIVSTVLLYLRSNSIFNNYEFKKGKA